MMIPIILVLVMLTESKVQTEVDATDSLHELLGLCADCGAIASRTDEHERREEILDDIYFVFERRE